MLNLSHHEEINEVTFNIWLCGLSQIPLHQGECFTFFIYWASDPHWCLVTVGDFVKVWSEHVSQKIWTEEEYGILHHNFEEFNCLPN